ncbi:MAG: hypothetical protein RLZZ262_843 [Bacteroidota bacterium]|jgi:hypothetical protein
MASNKGFKTLIRLVFVRWFKAELKIANRKMAQGKIFNKFGGKRFQIHTFTCFLINSTRVLERNR